MFDGILDFLDKADGTEGDGIVVTHEISIPDAVYVLLFLITLLSIVKAIRKC